jgi:hypothetical protein
MIGALVLFAGTLATTGGRTVEMTRDDALHAAKEALVQAGVSGEDGRVVSANPVTWPDARLGCGGAVPPSPAPVTGFRVVLMVGQRVYRVHLAPGVATVCGSPLEVAPAEPIPDGESEKGPVVEAGDSDVDASAALSRACSTRKCSPRATGSGYGRGAAATSTTGPEAGSRSAAPSLPRPPENTKGGEPMRRSAAPLAGIPQGTARLVTSPTAQAVVVPNTVLAFNSAQLVQDPVDTPLAV